MMRAEGEASSDFQEYTLVALLSLAAHLAGGAAAERAALPAMSRYFTQDLDVLQQARAPASGLLLSPKNSTSAGGLARLATKTCPVLLKP